MVNRYIRINEDVVDNVKLIAVTSQAEKIILYCARVSSDQSNENVGLLNYLIRNKHWSPFEMVNMVLEINTTRLISQQIIRHRSFSFQEFSQRYSEVANTFGFFEARLKGSTNRQSSLKTDDEELGEWWYEQQAIQNGTAFDTYRAALDKGIAPEVARAVLPNAAPTKLYMNGTARSWIHYFDLRCDEHAQKEHRMIALQARKIFREQFPVTSEALWETMNP